MISQHRMKGDSRNGQNRTPGRFPQYEGTLHRERLVDNQPEVKNMATNKRELIVETYARRFMYIPRLLILPLLVSVSFAAKLPGNVRWPGNAFECVGPWKNPFLRPAFDQNGISLTQIVPPPEFRARDLKMVKVRPTVPSTSSRGPCVPSSPGHSRSGPTSDEWQR
jgi:hypothetical protein